MSFPRNLLVSLCVLLGLLVLPSATAESYWTREMNRVLLNVADDYMRYVESWGNVTILPSGIGMSILRRGHGDVAPAEDDTCLIHYTGYYRYPVAFHDTRQYPFPVRRRPSDLIPGMAEALKYMREGDRWFIYVPYRLAYGKEGNADLKIGPHMNLRFDIDVVRCDNPKGKTSEEIDAFLKPLLKTPMPPKSEKVNWEDL